MKTEMRKIILLSVGVLCALIYVLLVFTPQNINPQNTSWVIGGGGDNFQHYLGWRYYRQSPWIPNFLFMQNLNYPQGTSVIVTDSNPLFCVLFKLFAGILPRDFQFNGIWILLSYLLTAFFAGLVSWKLTRSRVMTLCSMLLVILNPVILQRALIHDTLTAHWLILAAVWLMINNTKKWNAPGWALLVSLTMLIHVYFLPMIAFVLALQVIHMVRYRRIWHRILIPIGAFAAALTLSYFLLGYDHILPQSGSYGELSMNLNAFINPDGTSSLLKDRTSFPLQYEGYNYFGLGVIILVLLGLAALDRKGWRLAACFLLPCLLYLALAVSNIAAFDQRILYEITLPEKLNDWMSVFRSSGRLAWPFYYLGIFGAVWSIRRFLSKCVKPPIGPILIMGLIVICQIVDLTGFIHMTHKRFLAPDNKLPELSDPFWQDKGNAYQHLYVSDGESKQIDMFSLYAAEEGMTLNRSANARGIQPIFGKEPVDLASLSDCSFESHSMVILLENDTYQNLVEACSDRITEIEGYKVILIP